VNSHIFASDAMTDFDEIPRHRRNSRIRGLTILSKHPTASFSINTTVSFID
jgi:hypothetical protein